jgi:hypothetical protein
MASPSGPPAASGDPTSHRLLPEQEEDTMNTQATIKIELTPEQKKQIEQLTGKQFPAVKLSLEVLEARVAPTLSTN